MLLSLPIPQLFFASGLFSKTDRTQTILLTTTTAKGRAMKLKRETLLQWITTLRRLPKGTGPGQLPTDIDQELARVHTALMTHRLQPKAAAIFVEQLSANIVP